MADFASVAPRLAKYIRLLSSDKPGECLAAVRAIMRVLDGDIHLLANHIEKPGGKLSEAEMQLIFNTGYEAGLRAAEDKHHGNGDFYNVNDMPSWHEIARWCQQHGDRLSSKEQQFINDMAARTMWREPTEKQEKWLRSIFLRLGGKV